jgi:hypothetical protein
LAQRVVEEGWTLRAGAEAAGVSVRCARKWVARYRGEGDAGLFDRSSAPRRVANRTAPERVAAIVALRKLRMTAAEIAEPAVRYERSRPGELIHVDVKKLGRITGGAGHRVHGRQHYSGSYTDAAGRRRGKAGWEFVHITVDDHSRLATPKCSRTRKRRLRSASSAAPAASSLATASRSNGS